MRQELKSGVMFFWCITVISPWACSDMQQCTQELNTPCKKILAQECCETVPLTIVYVSRRACRCWRTCWWGWPNSPPGAGWWGGTLPSPPLPLPQPLLPLPQPLLPLPQALLPLPQSLLSLPPPLLPLPPNLEIYNWKKLSHVDTIVFDWEAGWKRSFII